MERNIKIIPNQVELEQQFEYVNSLIELHRSSAISKVNTEALLTNWEVGQYISIQLKSAHWGAKIVSDLADYLKRQNPKRRGFGKRHLYNMVKFYELYSEKEFAMLTDRLKLQNFEQSEFARIEQEMELGEIVQLPIAQLAEGKVRMQNVLGLIPFTSHIEIMNRCRTYEERIFYMLYAAQQHLKTEEMYYKSNVCHTGMLLKNRTISCPKDSYIIRCILHT